MKTLFIALFAMALFSIISGCASVPKTSAHLSQHPPPILIDPPSVEILGREATGVVDIEIGGRITGHLFFTGKVRPVGFDECDGAPGCTELVEKLGEAGRSILMGFDESLNEPESPAKIAITVQTALIQHRPVWALDPQSNPPKTQTRLECKENDLMTYLEPVTGLFLSCLPYRIER